MARPTLRPPTRTPPLRACPLRTALTTNACAAWWARCWPCQDSRSNDMKDFNILSRRAFFDRSFKISMGVALSTLVDIPFVVKRALAEGNIGLNGKKVLFIWL